MAVTHGQATVHAFCYPTACCRYPKRKVDEDHENCAESYPYSQHFAADGTFTNIRGMFFTGHQAFLDRHEEIFKGMFRGTVLRQDVVSLRFVRSEVAVVETLTWVSGFSASGPPPGTHVDAKGRLRTRLLQVMVKDAGEWKITVYHNVDIKPGVTAPEPE